MYQILLQRDGAQASMCGETHGDPPHTQADLGVGGCVRERELQLHHHAARSRDQNRAERGGDPPRHRSCDTRQIGRDMRALGLVGPMPRLNSKYTRNPQLIEYIHGRPIYGHDDGFLLITH